MGWKVKRLSNPEQEEWRTEELRCGGVGEGRQGTARAVGLAVWCGGCGGAPLWGNCGGPVLGSGGGALVGSGGGWPRGGGGGRPMGAWPRAGGAGGFTRALCAWCRLLGTLTLRGGGGGPVGLGWGGSASRAESGAPKLCLRARAAGAASRPPGWRGPPRVPNLEAAEVTTAGLLGGGGGLTAGARRGRLAPPPRLDWEADLVTPGGLLGSGGPVRLRPSGVGGAAASPTPGDSALRLGLWLDGGGAGGGPRGLTSAGKGAGARRTGGVSACWGAATRGAPGAGLEEAGCCRELGRGAPDMAIPDVALPVGRNLGIPPAKSPAKPGGAASFPAPLDGGGLAFLEPSMMGALRSLVTAFLSMAPPRISDSRADRSGGGPPGLGGPRPPIGGGGGGGGGMLAGHNRPPLVGWKRWSSEQPLCYNQHLKVMSFWPR